MAFVSQPAPASPFVTGRSRRAQDRALATDLAAIFVLYLAAMIGLVAALLRTL
jgi:hypothetical protein